MFVEFFYTLRKAGVPATPTAFLRLQKALDLGLIESLEDFYVAARAIMVKSERYFDLYDRMERSLRTLDALHLATASVLGSIVIATADDVMRRAALQLQLEVAYFGD